MKIIKHKLCNGIAFKYNGALYGTMKSELALLNDGSVPNEHDKIICGSCGEYIKYPADELEELK